MSKLAYKVVAALLVVATLMAAPPTVLASTSDGTVHQWGHDYGDAYIPAVADVTALSGGGNHSLLLRSDGAVLGWGFNGQGQAAPPVGLSDVVSISAGDFHSVALRVDGTVAAWGHNFHGQTNVPSDLNGVTGIAGGGAYSLAVKNDGSVRGWGRNDFGQAAPPAYVTDVVEVSAGNEHSLGLRSDGTVIGWGRNHNGALDIPTGLSGVTAITAGLYHSVALKADGTVVAWGWNSDGQASVPSGLTDVVAISAGWYHTLALKSDGTVVAWGQDSYGQSTAPPGVAGVSLIDAGGYHSLALASPDETTTPTLGEVVFSENPKAVGQASLMTVTVLGEAPEVSHGEYFFGSDPGRGGGIPMQVEGNSLSADIVTSLSTGLYHVGVRAADAEGDWSEVSRAYLVVYDPDGGFATGGGWIVPGGASSDKGDLLPGLDGTSKANFGFVVRYASGSTSVPGGKLEFHYNVGSFHLRSVGMEWLVVTNTNWARFQGSATVDGADALYPFRVDARDGDAIGQSDRLVVRIWEPGSDPDTEEPIYKASGDVVAGAVKIHR